MSLSQRLNNYSMPQHCWQLFCADASKDGADPPPCDVSRFVCGLFKMAALVSRLFDIRSQMRSTSRSNTIVTLTLSLADVSKNSKPGQIKLSSFVQLSIP